MASLFVIQGADQGKRFELPTQAASLGRDGTNPVRLHDSEISRGMRRCGLSRISRTAWSTWARRTGRT